MIKLDEAGHIIYPDGFRKNYFVEKIKDKSRMHILEEEYERNPHRYRVLKTIDQVFIEGRIAMRRNVHKRVAANKGMEWDEYLAQYGDLAFKEVSKELELAKQQAMNTTPTVDGIEELILEPVVPEPKPMSKQATPEIPEVPEYNVGGDEPVADEPTDQGALALDSLIDSGDVVRKGAWYAYEGRNFRKGELVDYLSALNQA